MDEKVIGRKAKLEDQMSYLETDLEDFINQELLALPYTLHLPKVLGVLH